MKSEVPYHDATTAMLHHTDTTGHVISTPWFAQDATLETQDKSFITVTSDNLILLSEARDSFRCLLGKLAKCLS